MLIMAVAALATMLVSRRLPDVTDRAQELQTGSRNRREQAQRQMTVAARERGSRTLSFQPVGASGTVALTLSVRWE